MPVYVDDQKNKYGRMVMCHMIADTVNELHEMADKIGVPRRWFQNKPGHPHYDICLEKRQRAVGFGAKEITGREAVRILKQNYSGEELAWEEERKKAKWFADGSLWWREKIAKLESKNAELSEQIVQNNDAIKKLLEEIAQQNFLIKKLEDDIFILKRRK